MPFAIGVALMERVSVCTSTSSALGLYATRVRLAAH